MTTGADGTQNRGPMSGEPAQEWTASFDARTVLTPRHCDSDSEEVRHV